MHVKQPVKKYFKKNNAFQWDAYCTDRQLTVAKPKPPWGLVSQFILLSVDYLLSGWLFEQMFVIISSYICLDFYQLRTW